MKNEQILQLLLERNARECNPATIQVHQAYTTLLQYQDALQKRCELAERRAAKASSSRSDSPVHSSHAAFRKQEIKLREKLEKCQADFSASTTAQLQLTEQVSKLKDLNTAQERTIANLKDENARAEKAIVHLEEQLNEANSRAELAEKQYEGLKTTIRSLQDENDSLKKENHLFESRLVAEKGKNVDEMNTLTDMVESLKRQVDMLRSLKAQEEKRRTGGGWFGSLKSADQPAVEPAQTSPKSSRRFGSFGVFLPTSPKHIISAHSTEGTCVRYDSSGADLVATASNDATVKVWETASGKLRANLRANAAIMGCDLNGKIVAGASSDKTCRIWDLESQRMIHQLVGHQHKVTCVRLFGQSVLTASADRTLHVWDIARRTYRQTVTLRHGSTANCIDIQTENVAASGHLDGGLRFWDLRSGERTADIAGVHEGGVTSVQFHPSDSTKLLSNGLDSCLRILDMRKQVAVQTFKDPSFQTFQSWSRAVLSPDGSYAAAGSNMNGTVVIWKCSDGSIAKKLESRHESGVCSVDWSRGGSSGQQFATLDRKGKLLLWA